MVIVVQDALSHSAALIGVFFIYSFIHSVMASRLMPPLLFPFIFPKVTSYYNPPLLIIHPKTPSDVFT